MLCVGAAALDLGALTAFLYAFNQREKIYNIFETASGQRFHPSYTRVGGLMADVTDEWVELIRNFVRDVPEGTRGHRAAAQPQPHLRRPHQGHRRPLEGGGDQHELHRPGRPRLAASSATCARTSRTSPIPDLRARSRSSAPRAATASPATSSAWSEMIESLKIIHGGRRESPRRAGERRCRTTSSTIPDKTATYRSIEGLIQHFELFMWNRRWEPPVEEVYGATETPNGELGFYMVADGSGRGVPRAHAAAVVHPLCRLPADDGRAPDYRRAGGAGEPEHHRGGVGSMSWLGDPMTWDGVKAHFPIGVQVTGVVQGVAPFGVFVRLGDDGIGLLRVPEMGGDGPKQMTDYPQVGDTVTAKVIWHDDRNRQVTLTQRTA